MRNSNWMFINIKWEKYPNWEISIKKSTFFSLIKKMLILWTTIFVYSKTTFDWMTDSYTTISEDRIKETAKKYNYKQMYNSIFSNYLNYDKYNNNLKNIMEKFLETKRKYEISLQKFTKNSKNKEYSKKEFQDRKKELEKIKKEATKIKKKLDKNIEKIILKILEEKIKEKEFIASSGFWRGSFYKIEKFDWKMMRLYASVYWYSWNIDVYNIPKNAILKVS